MQIAREGGQRARPPSLALALAQLLLKYWVPAVPVVRLGQDRARPLSLSLSLSIYIYTPISLSLFHYLSLSFSISITGLVLPSQSLGKSPDFSSLGRALAWAPRVQYYVRSLHISLSISLSLSLSLSYHSSCPRHVQTHKLPCPSKLGKAAYQRAKRN